MDREIDRKRDRDQPEFHTGVGSTPIPDPTERTTQALLREIAALKELLFTRLDGMDRAIVLFNENITRVPTDVDKQIAHLKELVTALILEKERITSNGFSERDERFENVISQGMELVNEKFASVQTQFKERDVRVEQTAKDTKVAVDAALQAAEKAVSKQNEAFSASIAKSESATSKQIDAQGALITSSTNSLDGKINDIKERLTRIESYGIGAKGENDHSRANIGIILGVLGFMVSVTFLVIALTHSLQPAVPATPPAVVQPSLR